MKNSILYNLILLLVLQLSACSSGVLNDKYKTAKLVSVIDVGSGNNRHKRYHYTLTTPHSLVMAHDPVSVVLGEVLPQKRGKDFHVVSMNITTDSLGKVQGNKVRWDGRALDKRVVFYFAKDKVRISNMLICDVDGLCDPAGTINGNYPIVP